MVVCLKSFSCALKIILIIHFKIVKLKIFIIRNIPKHFIKLKKSLVYYMIFKWLIINFKSNKNPKGKNENQIKNRKT